MTELWRLGAGEIARRVRAREVSATEVCRDALARLDAVNPAINAVVDPRPEDALAAAAAVDRALAAGLALGPLAGVPVTVKDNVDQAGCANTNGLVAQRDLVATADSPVVTNLRRAGAVIIGRTNVPAFSARWFTDNRLHGRTRNPRDPTLTPGGSSGGAAAAVAAGIGALAHGTDIAGSVRFPAYACGVHGLRPTLGRIPAFNASAPERSIGGQLMAVSGPLARTIGDLRLALDALAQPDARDPWYVPAPLAGPPAPRRAALCLRPDGLVIDPAVEAALLDAAARLERAGWAVDARDDLPPLAEAADLNGLLWIGDGYADKLRDAEREGDAGALAVMRGLADIAAGFDLGTLSRALTRRATLLRQWQLFLDVHPVVLLPVCGELPFADDADLGGGDAFARLWRAQLTQAAIPFLGLPALTVSTGLAGTAPVGVQLVAARFREDLCLQAGEAIEAGGVPSSPIDPVGVAPVPAR